MVVKSFNHALFTNIVNGAKEAIKDSNDIVHTEVRRLVLETPKTGKVRPHKITGAPHQASAPGETYANETGNALTNTKKYVENGGLTGRITSEAEYAYYLEVVPLNRPALRPAITYKQKEIGKKFEQKIKEAVAKS